MLTCLVSCLITFYRIYLKVTDQPILKQALVFTCLQHKSIANTVEKGEIARNEQVSPFPTLFSTRLKNFLPFSLTLKLSSANSQFGRV